MNNGDMDLSFRFKPLSMRLSESFEHSPGKEFKLSNPTFVSQPALVLFPLTQIYKALVELIVFRLKTHQRSILMGVGT
jgi:hypothetical protein